MGQQDILNAGGSRPDPRMDPNFLYFQSMLRNSEGRASNPSQGQQPTSDMIEAQTNNIFFSVLLNSISQGGQASFEQPNLNNGSMEFERPPDGRDSV